MIYLVTTGTCVLRMDGVEAELLVGDVAVVLPGRDHEIFGGGAPTRSRASRGDSGGNEASRTVDCGSSRSTACGGVAAEVTRMIAGPVGTAGMLGGLAGRPDGFLYGNLGGSPWVYEGSTAALARLLVTMAEESDDASQELVRILAETLVARIVREELTSGSKSSNHRSPSSRDGIERALALMHDEPGRSWSLGSLATAVGMSKAHFANRFRTVLGCNPIEYLNDWRMVLASRELMMSRTSLPEIARCFGFASENVFVKAARNWSGSSMECAVREGRREFR